MPDLALAAASTSNAPGTNLDVSVAMWAGLSVLVIVMLVVDLFAFGRGRDEVSLRSSVVWSIIWIGLALAFGAAIWVWQGSAPGSEYLAGYLLERSLSLDNIFVFAVIFAYFAVPLAVQPRVLAWGIGLALVLRLVFILLGAALIANFHATFYLFGALLLYTGYKLARHDNEDIEPEHNPALKMIRRRVSMSKDYDGAKLFTHVDGKRLATPLLAVFVVVATTDLIFAVDSIPAIFAVTQEPFIVFAANAFAMLGLRALYFVLVGMMDRFAYLSYGLAFILVFIGAKMLLIDVWHVPIWLSLTVIVLTLVVTAVISVKRPPPAGGPKDEQRPDAPSPPEEHVGPPALTPR